MASGNGRDDSEFWRFTWDFTFYKNSNIDFSNVKFKPWNVISLSSTYRRLQDVDNYKDFINCVKSIILVVKPFYDSIDDVADKVKKSGSMGLRFDEHILPREIFWGNYWGKQYVEITNPCAFDFLLQNGAICEKIGEGCYFSFTESAFDFNTQHVIHMERRFSNLAKIVSNE